MVLQWSADKIQIVTVVPLKRSWQVTAARADGDFLFAHLKVVAGQKNIATTAAAVASLSGVVDPPQRHGVAGEVIHATSSRLGATLKTEEMSVYVSRGGMVAWRLAAWCVCARG